MPVTPYFEMSSPNQVNAASPTPITSAHLAIACGWPSASCAAQLFELEGENTRLREELARRDSAARRVAGVAAAAGLGPPAAAGTVPPPLADRQAEPIYDEARRVARLRSGFDLPFASTRTRSGTA